MLYRSPGFRARVLPLFGIPIAMMLLASTGQQAREQQLLLGMTLQFPAIYLPFLVLFLPFAEHEGAAWLFETSPHHSVELAREASLLALSVRVLLPIHLIAGVALIACGFDPAPTASLVAFSWGPARLLPAECSWVAFSRLSGASRRCDPGAEPTSKILAWIWNQSPRGIT